MHGADRRGREVVEREVAVGDRIERVRVGPLEAEVGGERIAVDVPVEPGEGAGPGRHVRGGLGGAEEAAGVALEHPEVGEQVVPEVDGLRPLQVGVGGRGPVAVRLGLCHQASISDSSSAIARAEWARTSRARSVATWSFRERAVCSLPPTRPDQLGQAALDRHVDVLVVLAELEAPLVELAADAVEALGDLPELGRRRARRASPGRARAPSTARRRTAPGAGRTRSRS